MTVKQIPVNMICLEYRQEPGDEHYGSCLWARFYFNLDRYELQIMSDCGNYGYKWVEGKTPFLNLMLGMDEGYLIGKLYGQPDIFDWDKTKKRLLEYYDDEQDDVKESLNRGIMDIENDWIPESESDFYRQMDEHLGWIDESYYYVEKVYPMDAIKICSVFENYIKPKIKEILEDGKYTELDKG